MSAKQFEFQADIKQLMNLIVNAFYSEREVCVRELISNASDAINKFRCEAVATDCGSGESHSINLVPDKSSRTLTFEDTGIGMTEEELIENFGTIAKSGTRAYLNAHSDNPEATSMVGQFGVGFYSAFLIADNVVVTTQKTGSKVYRWSSSAEGSFDVSLSEDQDAFSTGHGTKIVLFVKSEHEEYLEDTKLKDIIHRHSKYITFPINLMTTSEVWVDDPEEEEEEEEDEDGDDDKPKIEDVDDESSEPKAPKRHLEEVKKMVVVNQDKPIWLHRPEELTPDDYKSFYTHMSGENEPPCQWKHFNIEGQVNLRGILFIPTKAPMDLYDQTRDKSDLTLYVKRVLIGDKADEFCPPYLRFIRGVVDSDDLEVNISRECLQGSQMMDKISKAITKKAIEMLSEFAETRPADYDLFYLKFGKHIKLGVHEDQKNQTKLSKLLRFMTTKSCHETDEGELVSLDDYCARAQEGQKSIYYITGPDIGTIRSSPYLEGLIADNLEVLYLTEPIDEYSIQSLKTYGDFKLVSARGSDTVKRGDEEENQKISTEWKPFCEFVKSTLSAKINNCIVSRRVVSAPCCLVDAPYGWSANMEKLMRNQAMRDGTVDQFMISKPILEINVTNPLVKELRRRFDVPDPKNSLDQIKSDISNMYSIALISGGFYISDLSSISQQLNRLLAVRVLTNAQLPEEGWDNHFVEDQQDLSDELERKRNIEMAMDNLPEDMKAKFKSAQEAFANTDDSVKEQSPDDSVKEQSPDDSVKEQSPDDSLNQAGNGEVSSSVEQIDIDKTAEVTVKTT